MAKTHAKVLTTTSLHRGKHLILEELSWQNSQGAVMLWERVKRTGPGGSVSMIARLTPSNRYIVIKQFRPPLNSMIYEFPAGLMDEGETPESTALRELKEEYGCKGKIQEQLPPH